MRRTAPTHNRAAPDTAETEPPRTVSVKDHKPLHIKVLERTWICRTLSNSSAVPGQFVHPDEARDGRAVRGSGVPGSLPPGGARNANSNASAPYREPDHGATSPMHESPDYSPDASVSPDSKPTSSGVASLDRIREAFPALMRLQRGAPAAYFDAPGGTQVTLTPSSRTRKGVQRFWDKLRWPRSRCWRLQARSPLNQSRWI